MLAAARDYRPTRFVIPSGLRLWLTGLRPDLRSTFLVPVPTPSGDIKLMKPQALNPALMAVRCIFPPVFGASVTTDRIYSAVFSIPFDGDRDQFLHIRDNNGDWVHLSATRFEPCNPKRRPLFRHLNTDNKKT